MADAREVQEPTIVARGLIVNEVYNQQDQALADGNVLPPGPGLGFQFNTAELQLPNIVLVGLTDAEMDQLLRSVRNAVKMAKRQRDGWTPPEPIPVVRCPGCNQRLFGPVAKRGGCLSCFPTIPGDK